MAIENQLVNANFQVYVIIAETLQAWQNLNTDLGKKVLEQHYAWGSQLKQNEQLILAGPLDFELTSTGKINANGHTTGIIMLKAKNREQAKSIASQDPFHLNGFRKNVVYSMNIRMTQADIFNTLNNLIK